MDFKTAAKLGHYISRDYAENFFELLVNYRDISASEAASRLNLHINTAQDFLEAMTALGIVTRQEVHQKKRPYFRYSLKSDKISIEVDLADVRRPQSEGKLAAKVRERKNAGARFVTARSGQAISNIAIWSGQGRQRQERKVNLTAPQGIFLYHLPFPDGEPLTIRQIMQKAGIDHDLAPEILDLIELLLEYDVIETVE